MRTDFTINVITDKGSSNLNEDSYSINDKTGIFAVFDGATSLTPFKDRHGKSGAFLASNIASSVFENENGDLSRLVHKANSKIRQAMLDAGINVTDKLNLWGTSIAAIKINKGHFDWVQISDTLILVLYSDGSYKLLVKDYDHDYEMISIMKRLADSGVENLREGIFPELVRLRRRLNVDYGVIAGQRRIRFLNKGRQSLANVRKILIFSDGLLIPKSDPEAKDDIGTIVKRYKRGGLRGWLRYVRQMEKADPKLTKYPRYKQYDDATAIEINFK